MSGNPVTPNRVGVLIWLIGKTGELQDAWDLYQASKSQDAAIQVGTKLAEIVAGVAAGIAAGGLAKMFQKTGLDRVFDSIRKDQSLKHYKDTQRNIEALSGYAAGEATDALIDWGRDYVNENQTLDPLFFFWDDLLSGQVKEEFLKLF